MIQIKSTLLTDSRDLHTTVSTTFTGTITVLFFFPSKENHTLSNIYNSKVHFFLKTQIMVDNIRNRVPLKTFNHNQNHNQTNDNPFHTMYIDITNNFFKKAFFITQSSQ